jgi:hypothetical protein
VTHQIIADFFICASAPNFLASIIALIAVYVAIHQYTVTKAKLKLDLFDKRYPIFQETWEILSEVAQRGTRQKSYGLGNPFSNFIPQAAFLFGKDVEVYLNNAVKKWTEFRAIEGETERQGINRLENIAKRSELEKWFFNEASLGATQLFGRYLEFERWK